MIGAPKWQLDAQLIPDIFLKENQLCCKPIIVVTDSVVKTDLEFFKNISYFNENELQMYDGLCSEI